LSDKFNRSIPTIYKDLDVLEEQNELKKIYGGIKILNLSGIDNFYKRMKINSNLKEKIAREAIKLIQNEEIIALDASTTSYYLAKEIIKDINRKVLVATNSGLILSDRDLIYNKNIDFISTGGYLNKEVSCFVRGNEMDFSELQISKFFFSSYAFSEEYGVMDSFIPDANRIKKFFSEVSNELVCLVDSTKFNKNGYMNWINIKKINKIIIDDGINEEITKKLKSIGMEVLIAS
jgi:DeoR family glycerol-3-phosphate regulon repressor